MVVDYAIRRMHWKMLQGLRAHLPEQGRLWCLFGCGGDRDAGKRPLMAAAAERHADVPVITDDNPRSEPAAAIREQILAGLSEPARRSARIEAGRAAAIRATIAEADVEDVILIAGKGHETYQEIEGVRHPFSDLDEARAALAARHGRVARERRWFGFSRRGGSSLGERPPENDVELTAITTDTRRLGRAACSWHSSASVSMPMTSLLRRARPGRRRRWWSGVRMIHCRNLKLPIPGWRSGFWDASAVAPGAARWWP